MKILVTGATGFAGSHLVEALRGKSGVEIFGTTFHAKIDHPHLDWDALHLRELDLTDKAGVDRLIQEVQPDHIYHLASFAFVGKSFERADELLQNNIHVQLHLLEAVRLYAPQARVLSIGSAEEYGYSEQGEVPIRETHPLRPVNPYAVSKVTQEMLAIAYQKSFGMNIVRVRPFNHIGERQSPEFAIPAFVKQIVAIERGQQTALKVGLLTAVRDFTDVKDMVRAYITIMEAGVSGEVYNAGSGVGVSMAHVIELLKEFANREILLEVDETRVRPFDVPEIIANVERLHSLGWKPTIPLQESLRRVLEFWRAI